MQALEVQHYTKLPIYKMKTNLRGTPCTGLEFLTLLVTYHEKEISSYFIYKINLANKCSARYALRSLQRKGFVDSTETDRGYKTYKLTEEGEKCFLELYAKVIM